MSQYIPLIIVTIVLYFTVYFLIKFLYKHERWRNKKIKEAKIRENKETKEIKVIVDKAMPYIYKSMKKDRIVLDDLSIKIKNKNGYTKIFIEKTKVLKFNSSEPIIKVYEDNKLIRSYKIDINNNNPDLKNKYFHFWIRINTDSSVQLNGAISELKENYDKAIEYINFQPFFLSNMDEKNKKLIGKGGFARGFQFPGIMSGGSRAIAICDFCDKSFSLSYLHAGRGEFQYFYSENSREILFVYYGEMDNVPIQNQPIKDIAILKEFESKLPISSDGLFLYYNPLVCPYCQRPYFDFKNNKADRPYQYYAHYYLNQKPINLKK